MNFGAINTATHMFSNSKHSQSKHGHKQPEMISRKMRTFSMARPLAVWSQPFCSSHRRLQWVFLCRKNMKSAIQKQIEGINKLYHNVSPQICFFFVHSSKHWKRAKKKENSNTAYICAHDTEYGAVSSAWPPTIVSILFAGVYVSVCPCVCAALIFRFNVFFLLLFRNRNAIYASFYISNNLFKITYYNIFPHMFTRACVCESMYCALWMELIQVQTVLTFYYINIRKKLNAIGQTISLLPHRRHYKGSLITQPIHIPFVVIFLLGSLWESKPFEISHWLVIEPFVICSHWLSLRLLHIRQILWKVNDRMQQNLRLFWFRNKSEIN